MKASNSLLHTVIAMVMQVTIDHVLVALLHCVLATHPHLGIKAMATLLAHPEPFAKVHVHSRRFHLRCKLTHILQKNFFDELKKIKR